MGGSTCLFIAFTLIWTGVLVYLIIITGLGKQLEERIDKLSEPIENKQL